MTDTTAQEIRKKFNGFLEDAIDNVTATYKSAKGRKDRAELRTIYEDLVKMDTQRAGFRRYTKLV
jgi:hypothetical protein